MGKALSYVIAVLLVVGCHHMFMKENLDVGVYVHSDAGKNVWGLE